MRKLVAVLSLLLCCSCVANAGPSKTDTTGYPIPVHVSAARVVPECRAGNDLMYCLDLDVVIAGTKYELRGKLLNNKFNALLTPGNYKARVTSEFHNASGAFGREYELLLLDDSTWKGTVSAVSE